MSREKMHDDLAIAMGGRVAEELIFGYGKVTSGASSDIKQATGLAKKMVTQWGMSEKLGPLLYTDNEEEVFLGHSVARQQNISEETANVIDGEVRKFVEDANARATQILTDYKDDLHTIAKALLEYETLSGNELEALLRGESIDRSIAKTKKKKTDKPKMKGSVPSAGNKKDAEDFGAEPQPES